MLLLNIDHVPGREMEALGIVRGIAINVIKLRKAGLLKNAGSPVFYSFT